MSAPVTQQTAEDMINAYQSHTNSIKIPDGSGGEVTLKGLRFSKADIEGILNNNGSDELFLAFAVREGDLGKPEKDQYFTVVAAGIDTNNELYLDNAYDNADPCPSACPNGF